MKKIFGLVLVLLPTWVSAQTGTQVSTEVESSTFIESIKLNGDLRYRHEWIEIDSTRTRQRIRARVGATASPARNVDVGFQLATGADDPVSSNESLDSGFSKKSIGIDMAYIDYYPAKQAHVVFGKQKNPFVHFSKSELIWDGDLRPEGVSVHADSVVGNVRFDANAGMFWVEERSSGPDTYLIGAQLNADIRLARKMAFVVGGGAFGYTHIRGRETVFDPEDGFGNSLVGNEYANDYRLIEGTVGLKFDLLDKPAMVFFDTVLNTAVSEARFGWLAGVKFGKIKKGGDLAARYNYRRIDADAVLGVFTDSDFKGGGTNGAGHEIGVAIGLARNFQVGVSFFANSLNTTTPVGFYRGQVDFTIRI